MTAQPVAYSNSSSSNVFKNTPGFGLAGGRVRSRVATSKRRLSDLHEQAEVTKPVNIQSSGAGAAAPTGSSATPSKRGRRSLFEECQDRLSSGSAEQAESSQAANLETRCMSQAGQDAADCAENIHSGDTDHCMIEAVPMADQHILESNQDSTIEGHHLEDMMAVDPSEVCSPVKHTPASERPAEDGFHRTFMPFDMLRSPTSLGGQSFQTLNAHLAQNARLSTRQRNLRHDLRTATKEYVPEADNGIVASVLPWAAPAAVPAPAMPSAPQGGMQPIMVNVSRGGVVASSTVLNRGSGAGLISIRHMAGSAAMPPPHSIRRCIF